MKPSVTYFILIKHEEIGVATQKLIDFKKQTGDVCKSKNGAYAISNDCLDDHEEWLMKISVAITMDAMNKKIDYL